VLGVNGFNFSINSKTFAFTSPKISLSHSPDKAYEGELFKADFE
jgi:hypothetical protein